MLGVPVDSLHHNVPTLWIDPVVGVDVPLERDAEDPPLHSTCNQCEIVFAWLGVFKRSNCDVMSED